MPAEDYPLSPYYRDHVVDGITISRTGVWWTAALIIEDPKTKDRFISLYRWEQRDGIWKLRKSFIWRNNVAIDATIDAISRLRHHLPAPIQDVQVGPRVSMEAMAASLRSAKRHRLPIATAEKCPKCGCPMVIRHQKGVASLVCNRYPQCPNGSEAPSRMLAELGLT